MVFSEQTRASLSPDPLADREILISPIRPQISRATPRSYRLSTTPLKTNSRRASTRNTPENSFTSENIFPTTASAGKTWTISPSRKRADSDAISPWRIRVTVQAEPADSPEEMDVGYLTEPALQAGSDSDEDIWLDENSFRGRRITAGTTTRKIPLRGLSSSPPRQEMLRKGGTPKRTPKVDRTPKKTPNKAVAPRESTSPSKSSRAKSGSPQRTPSRARSTTPSSSRRQLTPAIKGDIHSILSLAASDSSLSPPLELSRNVTTRRGRSRSNSKVKELASNSFTPGPSAQVPSTTADSMLSYETLEDSTTPEGSPSRAMKSWLAQEEDSYLPIYEPEPEQEHESQSQQGQELEHVQEQESSYHAHQPAFAKSIYQDDSIMESEGFSMVSVSSIPSMRDATSSPSSKESNEDKDTGHNPLRQIPGSTFEVPASSSISQRGGPSSFVFPARSTDNSRLSGSDFGIESNPQEKSLTSSSAPNLFPAPGGGQEKTPFAISTANVPGIKKPGHKRQSSKGLETATNLHHLAQAGIALQEAVRSPEKSAGASERLKGIQEDDVFGTASNTSGNSLSIGQIFSNNAQETPGSMQGSKMVDRTQLPTPRASEEPEVYKPNSVDVSIHSVDEMSWKATTPPITKSSDVKVVPQPQDTSERPRTRSQRTQLITPARKAILNAAAQHLRPAPRMSPLVKNPNASANTTEMSNDIEQCEEDDTGSESPFAPQFTSSIILPDVGILSDPWKTGQKFDWSVQQPQIKPVALQTQPQQAPVASSLLQKSPVLPDEIQDLTEGIRELDTENSVSKELQVIQEPNLPAPVPLTQQPKTSVPKPKIKPLRLWGRAQFKDLNCVYLESLMDPPMAPKKSNLPRDLETIDLSEQVFEAYGHDFVISRNDLLVCLDFLARLMKAEKFRYSVADKDVDGRRWDLNFLAEKLVAIKIGDWLSTKPELREDLAVLEMRGKAKLDAAKRKAKEYAKSELSVSGKTGRPREKTSAIGNSKLREPLQMDGLDETPAVSEIKAQPSAAPLPSDGRRWRMW